VLSFFFPPPCTARLVRRDGHPSSSNRVRRHTQHRPRLELRGFCGLLYYRVVVVVSFFWWRPPFPSCVCVCGGVPAAPITCAVGSSKNVLMCVRRRLYLDNISESKMGETTGSKRHTRLTLNGKIKKMIIIIINSSSELVISRD
jgi:hypothetical protein